jgi:hypothetical protein
MKNVGVYGPKSKDMICVTKSSGISRKNQQLNKKKTLLLIVMSHKHVTHYNFFRTQSEKYYCVHYYVEFQISLNIQNSKQPLN